MFIIRDIRFDVDPEPTTIVGVIDATRDSMRWAINIGCRPRTVDDLVWQPQLYHESLDLGLRDWRHLDGRRGEFPPSEITGNLGIYLFEHGEIGSSDISIRDRRDDTFEVEWLCRGDLYCGEPYHRGVPILVRADVRFEGIRVSGPSLRTPEAAAARLAREFELSTLLPPVHFDPQNVERCHYLFRPAKI